MKINLDADWRRYAATLPPGAKPLGTVEHDGITGALVRLAGSRPTYAQVVGADVLRLDGRAVSAQLRGPSARKLGARTRFDLWLPDDLRAVAERLGEGNISEGIRESLRRCA